MRSKVIVKILHLNTLQEEVQPGTKTSPKGRPPPTGTTARCPCNATKWTVTTIYNLREKFQRYCFLVSKKHLKPYIHQYKCYHIII